MNVNASKQRGAALVEFAFTFMVFMLFIFAIIEGAIIIFRWEAANEAVRAGVRTAIVNALPDGQYNPSNVLDCINGPTSKTYECGSLYNNTNPESSCKAIVDEMRNFSPLVTPDSVKVIYSCSTTKNPDDPYLIPLVTVELDTVYHSILLGVFGIDAPIPLLPSVFRSTRTGEDLYSN